MTQMSPNKGKAPLDRTETVRIATSVLARRIQQFSMTLIGRLMNPSIQRMESLLVNFPKIWKLEDKVVGDDLGQGLFQFNFEAEEEIQSVLLNGPYNFDGWMVSLVKWETIISSTYPSAINFWVKVTGIPMHLWEDATLRAIAKKVGILREIDEESRSFCVTVNGFNPLLFKLVVPFASGDEIIVSLEYEKLSDYCDHCYRLTHEMRGCPDLQKGSGEQAVEHQTDKRSGQRQHLQAKQGFYHNEGGWEKPRKFVKRALDFHNQDPSDGDLGHVNSRHHERFNGSVWGQKKQFTAGDSSGFGGQRGSHVLNGDFLGHAPSINLNRKGLGPVWPKPLYKAKQSVTEKRLQEEDNEEQMASKSQFGSVSGDVNHDGLVKDPVDPDFMVETDDLLEDGECPEGGNSVLVEADLGKEVEPILGKGTELQTTKDDIPSGAGNKHKGIERQDNVSQRGRSSEGGRQVKKGMVALPKPPAQREDPELELSGHWGGPDRELFGRFVEEISTRHFIFIRNEKMFFIFTKFSK
ncbi:PREDICTED: uncharacterized protein LOC104700783 [Camelina sativa]|uniref:Uncharacterized protein LOC104700783 n=1 Tax=Camelina sativa TaxID=90675 RepID=A0ABM1Q8P3_CAMSA|nr:PREDICTED: uncharacterized protein LOC104700783 [Camelina sativa]